MKEAIMQRRLAALMSADVVSYSRLMSEDDEATAARIQKYRRIIARIVMKYRGKIVDSVGDNFLAQFGSAVGPVRCAVEIQRTLGEKNGELPEGQRMNFRIGIQLADVVVDHSGAVYGEGLNIAARLESLASPGAICISDFIYQQVRRKLNLPVRDLGEQELKNIPDPVRVYEIVLEENATSSSIARAAATKQLEPPNDRPSVGVMPFLNMTADSTQEYFSDGLTWDIMSELVRIDGLFVAGHDSVMSYKNSGASSREIAQELGIRHVLEGTVRKSGRKVRIAAKLIDASTGGHDWAERYDRDLNDMFEVQDDITEHIVTALDVKLVSGEDGVAIRQLMREPKARELIYRGWNLVNRFTKADTLEARHCFREAARLEPESPLPDVYLGFTYFFAIERGWSESREETMQLLAETANRALALGDISGTASMLLAHWHLLERDYARAKELVETAMVERPSCQGAYSHHANIMNYMGQPEKAIVSAKQAIRLSPVTPTVYPGVLATAYYLSEHFDDALAEADRALTLAPDNVDAQLISIVSLMETGREVNARELAEEFRVREPGFSLRQFSSNQPYQDKAVLEKLVDSLRRAGLGEGAPVAVHHRVGSRRRAVLRPRY